MQNITCKLHVSEIISQLPNGIISCNDSLEIQGMLTEHQKARKFIDILINSDYRGYRNFLTVLKRNDLKLLAKEIEETEGM